VLVDGVVEVVGGVPLVDGAVGVVPLEGAVGVVPLDAVVGVTGAALKVTEKRLDTGSLITAIAKKSTDEIDADAAGEVHTNVSLVAGEFDR